MGLYMGEWIDPHLHIHSGMDERTDMEPDNLHSKTTLEWSSIWMGEGMDSVHPCDVLDCHVCRESLSGRIAPSNARSFLWLLASESSEVKLTADRGTRWCSICSYFCS